MCRSHPDGAWIAHEYAQHEPGGKRIDWYVTLLTFDLKVVNESTTHLFLCAGRIPTELGLLTNMKTMRLAVNKLTGTTPF